ncbi:MAG: J domain-containing protein [Lachnospiraceae bacterium]|nr:J domain-containing protein [Lachnospiraceae bacterium]
MEKFLKILKVNILSIIALPLLLLATTCKLIAKAMEKLPVIISILIFTGLLALGFEFVKNPDNGMSVIAGIIVAFVVAGLIILLLIMIARLAAAVVAAIWYTIIAFFEAIYNVTYTGFLKLLATCENDYQYISLDGKKGLNAVYCLFYTLLRIVNRVIVAVVSFALFASIALSILLVGSSLIGLSRNYQKDFGLNLFQAAARFDTFSLVYGIVMFICIMAVFVVVLLSLGIEWHEWAMELKVTSDELSESIRELQSYDWTLTQDDGSARGRRLERGADNSLPDETVTACLNTLNQHIAGLDTLGSQVESVLADKDNTLLRSTWGNYFRNLSEIADECSKYKRGIPVERFKQLIPQIKQLDRQRDEVSKLADKLQLINADPVKSSVFFAGCNTVEKLDKRYKSLCKAYHPDETGGDMETFQKMQDEYTRLKASM